MNTKPNIKHSQLMTYLNSRCASPKFMLHMKRLAAERDDIIYVDHESCRPQGIIGEEIIVDEYK